MTEEANTRVDFAFWPYTNSGFDGRDPTPPTGVELARRASEISERDPWIALAARYPAVAEGLLGLVRELEQLRVELASSSARFEEQMTAIAAAVRALGNATPAGVEDDGSKPALEDLLCAVLTPGDGAGEGFERTRRQLLELAAHVADLWCAARCGARAIDELGRAGTLQRCWLPAERPISLGGVEIAGCCRAATDCCGDWWECTRLSDGRVLVVVADAMGSGASAALLVGVLKGAHDVAVRYAARGCFSLAGLFAAFNRAVYGAARGSATVTCTAAIIDAARGELTFAGAGHPLPMHARFAGPGRQQVRCLPARGAVLGANPAQRYTESTVALRPGDAVVWCTDGILDRESARGRRFGARRLYQAIADAPSLVPEQLRSALRGRLERFAGARESCDDMALVVAGIPLA